MTHDEFRECQTLVHRLARKYKYLVKEYQDVHDLEHEIWVLLLQFSRQHPCATMSDVRNYVTSELKHLLNSPEITVEQEQKKRCKVKAAAAWNAYLKQLTYPDKSILTFTRLRHTDGEIADRLDMTCTEIRSRRKVILSDFKAFLKGQTNGA